MDAETERRKLQLRLFVLGLRYETAPKEDEEAIARKMRETREALQELE